MSGTEIGWRDLANMGGVGVFAGALFYLLLRLIDKFQYEMREERKLCSEGHRSIRGDVIKVGEKVDAVGEKVSRVGGATEVVGHKVDNLARSWRKKPPTWRSNKEDGDEDPDPSSSPPRS